MKHSARRPIGSRALVLADCNAVIEAHLQQLTEHVEPRIVREITRTEPV